MYYIVPTAKNVDDAARDLEAAAAVETTIKAIIDEPAAPADARAALLWRRATLAQEVKASAKKRAAERSGNVPDSGELAADDVGRDVAIAEIDRDTAEIDAIDSALERLATGRYGHCTECSAPIAHERLAQQPEAARCITCQQRHEQRSTQRVARL
jgi:RNA polymerase-binding protein DksA